VLVAYERNHAALDTIIGEDDDVAIAAITAAELLVGIELSDKKRLGARTAFIEGLIGSFPVEVYDLATAREHAHLLAVARRKGRPRGAHDLMIAATAIASSRVVVTADAKGFADLPGLTVRAVGAA
jgi:tRNA(fMet)-specific endonuclease VapC